MAPEPNLVPGWRMLIGLGFIFGLLVAIVSGAIGAAFVQSMTAGFVLAAGFAALAAAGVTYRITSRVMLEVRDDVWVLRRAVARDAYAHCMRLLEKYERETVLRELTERQHQIDMELGGNLLVNEPRTDGGHLPPSAPENDPPPPAS